VVIANHLRISRPLIHYNNNNNLKKIQNKIKQTKNKNTMPLSLGGRVCGAWRRICGVFSILREREGERAPKPIWVFLISSELLSGCFRNTSSNFLVLVFFVGGGGLGGRDLKKS
jgi:hypothetical protein